MCLNEFVVLIVEHNSKELGELEEEVVEPEGSPEDLIEVENSLLQDDSLTLLDSSCLVLS